MELETRSRLLARTTLSLAMLTGVTVWGDCGVQNQGLDDTEFFGVSVFARGGFNDWGNSGPLDAYGFRNFGNGVFNAQFEVNVQDTYEFKIADGGWSIEYSNPNVPVVPDLPVTLNGGPALGGANTAWVVPDPGCYNLQMTILDDSSLPAPLAELLVTFIEMIPGDDDFDGVQDTSDNCLATSNPSQLDSDDDGIGNACDGDLNNDCVVNAVDLGLLKIAFFSTPVDDNWNPDADLNGDQSVSVVDLGRLKLRFFQNYSVANPSGTATVCTT